MELNKFLNITIKDYLNEHHVLNEYITNDEIYLRDYIAMSKSAKLAYLPQEYFYFFDDFIKRNRLCIYFL